MLNNNSVIFFTGQIQTSPSRWWKYEAEVYETDRGCKTLWHTGVL